MVENVCFSCLSFDCYLVSVRIFTLTALYLKMTNVGQKYSEHYTISVSLFKTFHPTWSTRKEFTKKINTFLVRSLLCKRETQRWEFWNVTNLTHLPKFDQKSLIFCLLGTSQYPCVWRNLPLIMTYVSLTIHFLKPNHQPISTYDLIIVD